MWGITFDEDNPFILEENTNRIVMYGNSTELVNRIIDKYYPKLICSEPVDDSKADGGNIQTDEQTQEHNTESKTDKKPKEKPVLKTESPSKKDTAPVKPQNGPRVNLKTEV